MTERNMRVIPLQKILAVFQSSGVEPYPFLESFRKEYSKKVSEDRESPLFSRTSKYNSFPVRCQWKNSGNKKKKRSDPTWRKNAVQATKIVKKDGIKSSIIKVLNKITIDNFREMSQELIAMLEKSQEADSVVILAELILEKIWYDKSFYSLYTSLCQACWQKPDWNNKAFDVFQIAHKYYYSTFLEEKKQGPFKTIKEVVDTALSEVGFKAIFLRLTEKHFRQREEYILKSRPLPDSTQRYKLRRKLFGTVEILAHFFIRGFVTEERIHSVIRTLFQTGNGIQYEEEIEALNSLWKISHFKLKKKSQYFTWLQKERQNSKWSSRVQFMIQDILDTFDPEERKEKEKKEKKESNFEEKLLEKVLHASRSTDFKLKKKTMETVTSLPKVKKSYPINLPRFFSRMTYQLAKDCAEYGEHVENHFKTLSFLMKQQLLSFQELSEGLSDLSEDIYDIKIDAPKAPQNLSSFLAKLLDQTKNIRSNVLRLSTNDEGRKEWDHILRLTQRSITFPHDRVLLISF